MTFHLVVPPNNPAPRCFNLRLSNNSMFYICFPPAELSARYACIWHHNKGTCRAELLGQVVSDTDQVSQRCKVLLCELPGALRDGQGKYSSS